MHLPLVKNTRRIFNVALKPLKHFHLSNVFFRYLNPLGIRLVI